MTDNSKELKENSSYQNSLIYITLVLFALLQIGVFCVAWSCYLPFSGFGLAIPNDLHRAAWTLTMLPGIVIVLCLWMANMLNRRLGHFTLLMIMLEGIFLVLIPRIYTYGQYNEVSYFTSGFIFFFSPCVTALTVWELWGGRRAKGRVIPVISAVVPMGASAYIVYILVRLVVLNEIFPRVVICYILPVIMIIYLVLSLLSAFTSLISWGTSSLSFVVGALGTAIAAFEAVNYRPVRLLFVVGVIMVLLLQIYDMIKFVNYKEKRNDS